MKILFALTYYRPHISGLTIYVQRLAEALAQHGHSITVLTSRYNIRLPREETMDGVRVVRSPVRGRISKGVIMPTYLFHAMALIRTHDVVVTNLPSTPCESMLLPFLTQWIWKRPLAAIYHCDVTLPPGMQNRLIERMVSAMNGWGSMLADTIVAYTHDFAENSRILRRFSRKVIVIPPPIVIAMATPDDVRAFQQRYAPNGERLIAFVARLASEKGVEYAAQALPEIHRTYPGAKILFVGEHQAVIGEGHYSRRMKPLLDRLGSAWVFMGVLETAQMAIFFSACDVTILPSINNTESFGLVQVESMLCGTPVVATDLPGVRAPIRETGMGLIVPPRDPKALAHAVVEIIRHRDRFVRRREDLDKHFTLAATLRGYENLFQEVIHHREPIASKSTDD